MVAEGDTLPLLSSLAPWPGEAMAWGGGGGALTSTAGAGEVGVVAAAGVLLVPHLPGLA